MDENKEKISLSAADLDYINDCDYDDDLDDEAGLEETEPEQNAGPLNALFDSVFDAVVSLDPNESLPKTGRSDKTKPPLPDLAKAARSVNAGGKKLVQAASDTCKNMEEKRQAAAQAKAQKEKAMEKQPFLQKKVVAKEAQEPKSPKVPRRRKSFFTPGRIIRLSLVFLLVFGAYKGYQSVKTTVQGLDLTTPSLLFSTISEKVQSMFNGFKDQSEENSDVENGWNACGWNETWNASTGMCESSIQEDNSWQLDDSQEYGYDSGYDNGYDNGSDYDSPAWGNDTQEDTQSQEPSSGWSQDSFQESVDDILSHLVPDDVRENFSGQQIQNFFNEFGQRGPNRR